MYSRLYIHSHDQIRIGRFRQYHQLYFYITTHDAIDDFTMTCTPSTHAAHASLRGTCGRSCTAESPVHTGEHPHSADHVALDSVVYCSYIMLWTFVNTVESARQQSVTVPPDLESHISSPLKEPFFHPLIAYRYARFDMLVVRLVNRVKSGLGESFVLAVRPRSIDRLVLARSGEGLLLTVVRYFDLGELRGSFWLDRGSRLGPG